MVFQQPCGYLLCIHIGDDVVERDIFSGGSPEPYCLFIPDKDFFYAGFKIELYAHVGGQPVKAIGYMIHAFGREKGSYIVFKMGDHV